MVEKWELIKMLCLIFFYPLCHLFISVLLSTRQCHVSHGDVDPRTETHIKGYGWAFSLCEMGMVWNKALSRINK